MQLPPRGGTWVGSTCDILKFNLILEMFRDPRCTKYRKPRSFYGTPFGKYVTAAIGISSGIVYAFSYGLTRIPVIKEIVEKLKVDLNFDIIGSDLLEWHLEEKFTEILNIKEEEENRNENKKVHT
ncbi:hypothetical protein V1478_006782 [Vespula squamosa]|uniref:Uncharacterized protein n=1 Tax=Vespula squamosa TaxID=30214 RepID=A0ABD2B0V9_VESSQ